MRVTNGVSMRASLRDLNDALGALRTSQARLSSGKAIERVSDDPNRAVDVLALRQQLRRAEQWDRAATDTEARLRSADTALVSSLDVMTRVKELAVRASNSGTTDATQRGAIAAELRGLRDELLALANSEYLGRPLFNGTAAGAAYDPSTGAYLGNDAVFERSVASGMSVAANLTGEQVYGSQSAPGGDLFAVVDRLAAAVAAGDEGLVAVEHDRLDVAAERLGAAAAEIGMRSQRLETVRARAELDEVGLRERLSIAEDVDVAEALLTMQADENAYTAALRAASKVLPPSLVDYLV